MLRSWDIPDYDVMIVLLGLTTPESNYMNQSASFLKIFKENRYSFLMPRQVTDFGQNFKLGIEDEREAIEAIRIFF